MHKLKILLRYWRSILLALIILLLTTIRIGELSYIPELPFISRDKVAHFGVFFLLATFLMADLRNNTKLALFNIISIVIIICFIYGASIELIQLWFIEIRTGSFYDMIANMLGCITACYLQARFKWVRYLSSVFHF